MLYCTMWCILLTQLYFTPFTCIILYCPCRYHDKVSHCDAAAPPHVPWGVTRPGATTNPPCCSAPHILTSDLQHQVNLLTPAGHEVLHKNWLLRNPHFTPRRNVECGLLLVSPGLISLIHSKWVMNRKISGSTIFVRVMCSVHFRWHGVIQPQFIW